MAEYMSREDYCEVTCGKENREGYKTCHNCGMLNVTAADVQPVKQWVKLHDKHPDTEGLYLVCDQYGECEVVEYLPDIKSWFTHKVNGEIRYWMPLPKPLKDSDTNE